MLFIETQLKGAFIIDIERREDSRGFFARAFCQKEFEAHGLKTDHRAGKCCTQYQERDHARDAFSVSSSRGNKLVRCTRGAIIDIIVDLRPESLTPTFDTSRLN